MDLDEYKYPICAYNYEDVDILIKELEQIVPEEMRYISFAPCGGTSIEQVMKCFLYKAFNKNKKVTFYCFENSYHGITGLSLYLTRKANPRNSRINFLGENSEIDIRMIKTMPEEVDDQSKYNVLIVEPLKCTSGDVELNDTRKGLSVISGKENCYTVYDEVQTGIYSLLEPWGYQFLDCRSRRNSIWEKSANIRFCIQQSVD